jgi:cytochrome c2
MRTVTMFWIALVMFGSKLQAQEIEPEELRPGLITTIVDGKGTRIVRLEPTVALNWSEKEAGHPRLSPEKETITWEGYLNVFRNGKYRFDAILRGDLKVQVNGKLVYSANSSDSKLISGQEVELTSGVWPIQVNYVRPMGQARLELWWKLPQTPPEPIPHESLGHLPAKRTAELITQNEAEHGRLLFEEHACIRCHQANPDDLVGKGLLPRTGPNLTKIGSRVNSGWLTSWLADPKKLRPNTTMPDLFADDAEGKQELEAVTAYLVSLKGNEQPPRSNLNINQLNQSVNRGRALFTTTGCLACHQDKPKAEVKDPVGSIHGFGSTTGALANYQLGAIGSKLTPAWLQVFLQNPHANNPTTRMPNMSLNGEEARDLANFLASTSDSNIPKEFKPTSGANLKELIEKGKKLVTSKGCVNCHEFPKEVKTEYSSDLSQLRTKTDKGCLAATPEKRSPQFGFTAVQKKALQGFLKTGLDGAGSEATSYQARQALKRFNCMNCHIREGEGGLSTETMEAMQRLEKGENIDDVRPPVLTGVGHKMRSSWFKQVLTGGGRARSWMSLRMPQYGEANVGNLHVGLTKIEGAELDDSVRQIELNAAKIEAGRSIVGKTGLGCISCHDIAGFSNAGTRGPDLSTTTNRVRYEWYRRWLEQPQRMVAGTRMPQVFIDGKSTFPSVLNGHGDSQAEAMWAYMSLGQALPLPVGIEPPKGVVLVPGKEPLIFRTFLGEAGNRTITVGFPEGLAIGFDANECRLAVAWAGNFLDVSKVWNERGGNQAKLLGPRFWNGPQGQPFAISDSSLPPDFSARAKDPAYGLELPHLQVFQGKKRVHFLGYAIDSKGMPTFRYQVLSGDSDSVITVTERIEPNKAAAATGVLRKFTVEIPAKQNLWLNLGEAGSPRVFQGNSELKFDAKSGIPDEVTAGRLVVLPEGESGIVLRVNATNPNLKWNFHPKQGGGWSVLLKLPASETATKLEFTGNSWKVPRVEPSLLKALEE